MQLLVVDVEKALQCEDCSYNEEGQLEYLATLDNFELEDIDIILHDKYEPFGIIKLKRNAKTKLNGKSLQPPESKL